MTATTHPFEHLFASLRPRFASIRDQLDGARELDSFLMAPAAIELLRDLQPEEGLDQAINDFVRLVHAAWLFWVGGEVTVTLNADDTLRLIRTARELVRTQPIATPRTRYIRVAAHVVWAQLDQDEPYQPLDGWFATTGETMEMVACFGVHELRPGVSAAAVSGVPRLPLAREHGAPFDPLMPGGDVSGLFSVESTDELLALGWSAEELG